MSATTTTTTATTQTKVGSTAATITTITNPTEHQRLQSSSTNVDENEKSEVDEEEEDIYDEIEIEDMTFDPTLQIYHYPCPCGDRFEIAIADLRRGRDVAVCPGCSLMIRVVFDVDDLPLEEEEGEARVNFG